MMAGGISALSAICIREAYLAAAAVGAFNLLDSVRREGASSPHPLPHRRPGQTAPHAHRHALLQARPALSLTPSADRATPSPSPRLHWALLA